MVLIFNYIYLFFGKGICYSENVEVRKLFVGVIWFILLWVLYIKFIWLGLLISVFIIGVIILFMFRWFLREMLLLLILF